jgi:hypothetical protein
MDSIHDMKAGPLAERAPWGTTSSRERRPRNIIIGIATLALAALLYVSFRETWPEALRRPWYFTFGDSANMRAPSFPVADQYLLGVGKADITGFGNSYFRSQIVADET